jgi:hypothetical protein
MSGDFPSRPGLIDTVFDTASDLTESAKGFLASERGRKFRRNVATVVIVGAPVLSELPFVRRSWMARVLRTAAVGTLLVKGAEWVRDWEPPPEPSFSDSPA